jgi:hypothetical protein
MKTILISLFACMAIAGGRTEQETLSLTPVFSGFEYDVYNFIDEDGNIYEFESIEENAKNKYDLKKNDYKEKFFDISYVIETEIDEFDNTEEVFIIFDLKLIEE